MTTAPGSQGVRGSAGRGFRPEYPGEVPTLGWEVLRWNSEHLASPLDEDAPFEYTQEQAAHILRMYALDPVTGRRLYRRVHEEQAKGWGKSPFAASIAIVELTGPVCFDGWDANGRPVGVPWGTAGRPAPWVQLAAVSEDQTANTSNAMYGMLAARGGAIADGLGIDVGRTRLYRKDLPGAFLERVTASAGSREGQPVTFAVLDEPQLWTPTNHGDTLAHTILRNVAKMNGWGLFTGNAPVLGKDSMAERYARPSPGVLHLANRPSREPRQDDTTLAWAQLLREVYGGAWWMDLGRLVEEMQDPEQPWRDSRRFFFNLPDPGGADEPWVPADAWEACEGQVVLQPDLATYVSVRIAHDHRCAAIAAAQRQGQAVVLQVRTWEGDEVVSGQALEDHLTADLGRFKARVVADAARHMVVRPGPSVDYHGTFFERSAQGLRARGMVLLDVPNTPERVAPAAESLLELVLAGRLVHDGDPTLARHMANVTATPSPRGWFIRSSSELRVEAALAAMHAVHRALLAPAQAPKPATFRSW